MPGQGWLGAPYQDSAFCQVQNSCLGDLENVYSGMPALSREFQDELFVYSNLELPFERATVICAGPEAQGKEIKDQWIGIMQEDESGSLPLLAKEEGPQTRRWEENQRLILNHRNKGMVELPEVCHSIRIFKKGEELGETRSNSETLLGDCPYLSNFPIKCHI